MNFGTDIQRSGQTEKIFFSAERVNLEVVLLLREF